MAQCHKNAWGAFLPRVCKGLVVGTLYKDANEGGFGTLKSYSTYPAPQSMSVLKGSLGPEVPTGSRGAVMFGT